MKVRQRIIAIVLLLLVAATIVGLMLTKQRPAEGDLSAAKPAGKRLMRRGELAAQTPLVDQSSLLTARRLAALAAAPEELNLVHQAEKVADHEADLAFYDAERAAAENLPPLTPETRELVSRKSAAEAAVRAGEENIAALTKKLVAAPEPQKDNLQDQIDVAQAQLELDQDELDDAAQDLERAGADPAAKIRRLKAEHEASDKEPERPASSAAVQAEQDYQAHTLLRVFHAWRELTDKRAEIASAQQDAAARIRALGLEHLAFEKKAEESKAERESAKQQARGFSRGQQKASREESKATARAALDTLKRHSWHQKSLSDLDKRIQDEQEISDIYVNWLALVEARERAALHNLLAALLWILVVLLAVYAAHRIIEHLFTGMTAENKRIDTLRAVVKFVAEAVGAVAILFIVFGAPTQTTTVLGLAGAGLTVALKDFIVAFFGWFVLMGRNGIRVGDWVEINGVGGEVVEVGLLKTVLLETGSWTDAGHPTGRRVSFVNSFAIEGHFFNFTTSGQWMWDELQVLIPTGQDPYPIIDGIQKLVEKETEANASKAEAEWQQATTRYRVRALSAVPGINVRPTAMGIEVHVRYITRAYERHAARKRMYEAVVEMMHGKREAVRG
jgi:small-conductance mechanosensitive channel